MTSLKWRVVREIELFEAVVPNPDSTAQLLPKFQNIRVAFDGALVHIDPRKVGAPDHDANDPEFHVYAVPASSVRVIHYVEKKSAGNVAAVV
ncbi:hypothetical protein [Actinacidiphila sp. ITFR-21]|uniref:hypothetical protein n=1 Tax=Actinacidiphila sp. ITFR-21 TaxID=3075199 RepID=UPI00288BFAA5|nr:hypothetical protein [Streptomyces sp. ITFR-21]WNI19237.1 hypothetical protein RLT57_29280 [Streptomyces sp. ITFR-21]